MKQDCNKNRINELLGTKYPIIAGGMVWCSGHKLASAVSIAGGLGLIGAGSMYPDNLRDHIRKCAQECAPYQVPYGVNVPLFYPDLEQIIEIIIQEKVPVVFTSGGNPGLYTQRFKDAGIKVVHVVANTKFALKAQAAGCDAVVMEGFEAGGHNGRDELTTMVGVAAVARQVHIPVIAAGGIAFGSQMAAALALGAEGVQIGSRFAMCAESSAHDLFKERCREVDESGTMLSLKKIGPVRLIRNEFFQRVAEAEARGASADELREILGKGRAKLGMFMGDMVEGELEIGQVAAMINEPETVEHIFDEIIAEYNQTIASLCSF